MVMMMDLEEILPVVMVIIPVLAQEGLESLIMEHTEDIVIDTLTEMVVMIRTLEINLVGQVMKMMTLKMIPYYN